MYLQKFSIEIETTKLLTIAEMKEFVQCKYKVKSIRETKRQNLIEYPHIPYHETTA